LILTAMSAAQARSFLSTEKVWRELSLRSLLGTNRRRLSATATSFAFNIIFIFSGVAVD
jgi:hypothetical protein